MEKEILIIQREGNICTIVMNRPEKRNSLSPELLLEIKRAFEGLSLDDTIRTVVIRGAGESAFSSGYDISYIPTNFTREVQEKWKRENPLEMCLDEIINYPYPVIAMVNGSAFGAGCELAICCDIRVGADDIRMGMPPAKLGVVYDPHGIERFIQVLGLRKTKEIFFTGRYYHGTRLLEMGLVDYLVPRNELESFTYSLAREIAGNAPLSLKGIKRILNMLTKPRGLTEEEAKEADEIIANAFNSNDLKEAQSAFLEKRSPQFKGK
jgi:enoyl-CoA hydratase/carnithine racemase